MVKMKYYSLKNILSKNAQYNIVFGERSNGKTYAVLKYALERYIRYGESLAIVRRWQDDLRGKRGAVLFDNLVHNGEVEKITDGEWTNIHYYGGRWWLCRYDDSEQRITDSSPFAYGFSISTMEHDKSTSYPTIKNVLFDEFLTRSMYLTDEFVLFMNVLSTIIRNNDDVKIFMCGNAVNQYSPYFNEMGITHIKKMKPGDIDVYEYGDSGLRVAVEFSDNPNKNKPSDIYFAFDNPKLSMITGTGQIWEIDIYPHLPYKYKPSDILFKYFIVFNGDTLQCEIIQNDKCVFTYIHMKTSNIKFPENDIIFSPEYNPLPNFRRKITKPRTEIDRKIVSFFTSDKVFYQNNSVGEIVRNYLIWCGGEN